MTDGTTIYVIHMYIYIHSIYSIYTMTCICILFFFLFGVDWNQEKKAHQLRAKPKPLLAAIIFSRYGRHDACSQLSVFANTELLRPEDRGQSVVLGCLFGKACSILFCLHDLICCSLTKPSTESTDCRSQSQAAEVERPVRPKEKAVSNDGVFLMTT